MERLILLLILVGIITIIILQTRNTRQYGDMRKQCEGSRKKMYQFSIIKYNTPPTPTTLYLWSMVVLAIDSDEAIKKAEETLALMPGYAPSLGLKLMGVYKGADSNEFLIGSGIVISHPSYMGFKKVPEIKDCFAEVFVLKQTPPTRDGV